MQTTLQTPPKAPARSGRTAGPPRIFFIAQFIAAIVIGVPLIAYGAYCVRSGTFFLPFGYRRMLHGLRMEHGAALLASWACIIGGVGAAIHAGLTSIDRIERAAATAARFGGGLALLLFIAALIAHLVG